MAASFPTKANWAAGDVLTASALDDLAGTVNLLSNASATTGSQLISNAAGTSFAYQPTPSASNPVLNSAFQVWQRGTSFVPSTTGSTSYTADRWSAYRNATGSTVTRQVTGDTTNLPFIQYCARVSRDSGNTSTQAILLGNPFEIANAVPYAGKTITLSFYARKGATYSATSNALSVVVLAGTGSTETNPMFSGYTGQYAPLNTSVTLTTTWQRFTQTFSFASADTQFEPYFQFTPTGTAGATDYFEVTGVQIDVGTVALPFRTFSQTLQGETSACERYYQRYNIIGSYTQGHAGWAYGTTTAMFPIPLRTTMRVTPTSLETFQLQPWIVAGSTYVSSGTFALVNSSPNQGTFSITAGSAVFTAGQTVSLNTAANGSGYYGFSAEL